MADAPRETSRTARVDAVLREMFEALAARPVPSRLLSVIDQLDEEPGEVEPHPDKRKPKRA
jgi:hypothetical protein